LKKDNGQRLQPVAAVDNWNRPTGHVVQTKLAVVGEKEPARQSGQWNCPEVARAVPAAQGKQPTAPRPPNLPGAQTVHTVAKLLALNRPAGHITAVVVPTALVPGGQNHPGAQAVHWVVPSPDWKRPAGQGLHEVCPVWSWKLPAGQSAQLMRPTRLPNLPAGQRLHVCEFTQKVPAAQARQDDWPVWVATKPCTHGIQAVEAPGAYVPRPQMLHRSALG